MRNTHSPEDAQKRQRALQGALEEKGAALASDVSKSSKQRLAGALMPLSSTERPRKFLILWEEEWEPFQNPQFLAEALVSEWTSFDWIPHEEFQPMFEWLLHADVSFPTYLPADCRQFFDALPQVVTAYRGQDAADRTGLSWTTDRRAAEFFARGSRHYNANPVVLTATLSKNDIAFVSTQRDESELVLWIAPTDALEERLDSFLARGPAA